jgi:uncharacterized membrane protein
MSKKRVILLSSVGLILLLLAGLIGATLVFAQEPTPETQVPFGGFGGGRGHGRGGFGGGMFGAHGGQWTMFDTAAEALGLTPEELFAELHAGKSLDEVAEAQGVDMEAVQEAMNAARSEAMRQMIEQAVEDGNMTQEQADWMLEGLEKGFVPGGRGFGHGRGRGGCSCPDADTDDV